MIKNFLRTYLSYLQTYLDYFFTKPSESSVISDFCLWRSQKIAVTVAYNIPRCFVLIKKWKKKKKKWRLQEINSGIILKFSLRWENSWSHTANVRVTAGTPILIGLHILVISKTSAYWAPYSLQMWRANFTIRMTSAKPVTLYTETG